jgi:hypothetical protein
MPNILLPPQLFNVADINFPNEPQFHFRKLFFQCELRAIHKNGDLEMGLICYPSWKRGNAPRERWNIGNKARGTKIRDANPNDPNETIPFDPNDPLAFGNNESPVWHHHPLSGTTDIKQDDKLEKFNKFFSGEKEYLKETFSATSRIYQANPHASYDVSFSDGTTTSTNPCPPNQPGE